jgi:ABC-type transport system involved in multi-copper enzyme maturation permease subunit
MTGALENAVSMLPSLSWLTGPIFDKELRVSSRRKRNYILRSAYIALLSLFILYAWFITVSIRRIAPGVFAASRMPEAGKYVITTIIWFQFVAAQLIAVVMLSTAIGGEVRQRTLGVLMTTPINSLQIVMGKLLGKLLQIILLLGISLPLLAVVRVFGGVPWDYVVSGLCITLTAALFAGSLSLLLSVTSQQAYAVVLTIGTGYLILFGALPGLVGLVFGGGAVTGSPLFLTNPFIALLMRTYVMLAIPGKVGTFSSWPLHCAIMAAATAGVVALAVWRVRRIALSRAFGGTSKRTDEKKKGVSAHRYHRAEVGSIRRVEGAPIVWKEMRKPFFGRGRRDVIMYAVLAGIVLVAVVWLLLVPRGSAVYILFSYLMSGFSLLVMIRLAVLSAASITSEKEGRTWPILLTTPLEDREILYGKGIASFRRNLPLLAAMILWYLLLRLIAPFRGSVPYSYWLGVIPQVVTLAGSVVFLIGLGLYFGVRMKSTSAAVAATVGAYIGLSWFCCGLFSTFAVFFAMRALGPVGGGVSVMSLVLLARTGLSGLVYAGIGLLAVRAARRQLRQRIF